MKNRKCSLSILLLALFSLNSVAQTISLEISGITNAGVLHLAIYNNKEVFESDRGDNAGPKDGIVAGLIQEVQVGVFTSQVDLPSGQYAIALYVDVNGNKRIDSNFLGIPKEQYGFSNNVMGAFGPPKFEKASFDHGESSTVKIHLK